MRARAVTHLVGTPDETRATARRLVAPLPEADVLWVGAEGSRATLRRALGRSYDAVVLDQHRGADADAVAAAVGFVRAGGRLVLRFAPSPPPSPRLRVPPWPGEAIGRHLRARLCRPSPADAPASPPLAPAQRPRLGSADQQQAVRRLVAGLRHPTLVALVARRGRGKSTALGLALRQRPPSLRCALTAPHRGAADAVLEVAQVPWLSPLEALQAEVDLLVVDEAAQLSVALLRQLVHRHPTATLWFATTTGGYEGTGQGFVHRFLATLRADPRPLVCPTLGPPIRWALGDPLEQWADERLLLAPQRPTAPAGHAPLTAVSVRRGILADDEPLLRQVFALLTHAHYRTTPSDLQRLLDAPNLSVNVLVDDARRVAAVNLLAREGGLAPELCAAMARGDTRIRGQALADTLVCHAGRVDAGRLDMVRSVRIATHPDLRRRGLGRRLADLAHDTLQPDLFGTLFAATPELLRFRRAQGYRLVRLGASRGSRTGEPAAVMVRPTSPEAEALVAELREVLARDLPVQLRLLDGDGELPLGAALRQALGADLPSPTPWPEAQLLAAVAAYAFGPRPLEASASALVQFLDTYGPVGDTPQERALVHARLVDHRSWAGLTRDLGWSSVRVAMRAMRRAWQGGYRRVVGGDEEAPGVADPTPYGQ